MLKKLKKNKILTLALLVLLLVGATSLGRFVYLQIKKNILSSKDFYFESDKLREEEAIYLINNYNGVDNYDIIINMNSMKNNLLRSKNDIAYDINYTCSANANCSVSKTNGTIYNGSGIDSFAVSLSPNTNLDVGDSISIKIVAKSTEPYIKTLSANFTLIVGHYGLSYEIQDVTNRAYLEFKMTNTLDYYVVLEAFGTYQVNDKIDIDTYLNLSPQDQNKCASAIINLDFNPNVIIFDNNSIIEGLLDLDTTIIDNNDYINHVSFKMEAISSKIVRFYKKNKTQNYTYPIVNPNPIITVTYE